MKRVFQAVGLAPSSNGKYKPYTSHASCKVLLKDFSEVGVIYGSVTGLELLIPDLDVIDVDADADGVDADGVDADGVDADGVDADGVDADGGLESDDEEDDEEMDTESTGSDDEEMEVNACF